ncbi:hypothetical protein [Blastomonas fulva]|uniref:Lipoprotein n=1 Tax=Blastomonas fulva TaxID=1550728 RepID=A0ABN5B4A9_9SPHN|nr:hypothetical protein [Blastomonas fulva]ASR51950.1 hypothetical protein B5J99_11175 [Blastomonas fulva]MDM7930242.1 hypothetical protein [Blastomonas fulva]MDM7965878.1 hypothetical protein [Blastomonas fulva]
MRALVAGVVSAAVLAGCATPEARTRTALERTGLSRPVSACMAGRMVDRLSLAQLQRLGRLGRLQRAGDFEEFLRLTRALRDPEILAVVSSSGLVCTARN